MSYKIEKTEEEWKALLGLERYKIIRQKGTEFPHSGKYNLHFENGTYYCGGCREPLFQSNSKFNSHCGWPSFDEAIPEKVQFVLDKTHGMIRTEIVCSTCGGHLGHVFNDGPTPTGLRYCVNSLSVDFEENKGS
jgi:peptide-methionine (R)-S-oxide reductase